MAAQTKGLSRLQAHQKQLAMKRAERLAEANTRIAEARARREERQEQALAGSTSSVPWVAIGIGVIALVGVTGVIVYLMTKKDQPAAPTALGYAPVQHQLAAPAPQVFVINAGTNVPAPAVEQRVVAPEPAPAPRPRYHDDPLTATRR